MEFDDFDIIQANHHAAFGKPDRVRNSIQPSHDRVKAPTFPPIATRDFKPKEAKPWPLVIRIIATQKTPEDNGVGDTVKRVLAKMGGEAFEWVMSKAGVNCGCGSRKEWLNRHYRYPRVRVNAHPWRDCTETIRKPTSELAIVTIAIGSYGDVLNLSRSRLQAYAAKCGADYIELTNETQTWWGLEKFRVRHFQPHYKRILFIDCDILVRDNAPDLFQIVPEDSVGIHDDAEFERDKTRAVHIQNRHRAALFESQGLDKDANSQTLYNTGVVMCSSHHDIWQPMRKPFPANHTDEQLWIEQQIDKYPVCKLDKRFNNQIRFPDFQATKMDSWFIHLAGTKEKINTMKAELAGW